MPFDAVTIVIIGGVVGLLVWTFTSRRRRREADHGRAQGRGAHRSDAVLGAGIAATYVASHRDEDPTHGGDAGPVDSGSYVLGGHEGGGGHGGDGGGGGGSGDGGGGGD